MINGAAAIPNLGVSSTHPEYKENVERWCLVDDVVNSKAKKYIFEVEDMAGLQNHLPQEAYAYYSKRNVRYLDAAQFVNFTRRTKNTWLGAIFRKEPVIKLPATLSYLIEDASGANISMARLAQNICGEILEKGRVGLLTDFPASGQGLTEADQEAMNAKARMYMYKAESIINWHEEIENGIPKLQLVVLKECNQKLSSDGFTWTEVTQYRVLKLEDDVYVQRLYDTDETTILDECIPKNFDGGTWDHIPFVFIGSHNNNTKVDPSPLYDIACINIGHLRNSADYEESVHICGQPTLIIKTNMSTEQFDDANPGGVRIGSRRGMNIGSDSDAYYLQPQPNQLPDEAMKRKEEQAQMIGAKFVTPGGTNETAEGVKMRLSGETSELTIVSVNTQDALITSSYYAQEFMGSSGDGDIEISINTDFFELNIDAQMLTSLTTLMNNGVITKNDIRNLLRMSGDIDPTRTNEDIDAEVNKQELIVNPLTP